MNTLTVVCFAVMVACASASVLGLGHGIVGHGVAHGIVGHGVAHGIVGHGIAHGNLGHGIAHGNLGHGIGHGLAGHITHSIIPAPAVHVAPVHVAPVHVAHVAPIVHAPLAVGHVRVHVRGDGLEGQYIPSGNERHYDDGSYRPEHHHGHAIHGLWH